MNKSRDLTGLKFGRWTVIERVEDRGTPSKPRKCYLCCCSCGIEKVVFAENLTGGRSLSCGCLARERTSAAKFVDLTGRRFGRLFVMGRAPDSRGKRPRTMFWCKCDCDGKVVAIHADALIQGLTNSCGCVRRETTRRLKTTHGHTAAGRKSAEFRVWSNMKSRCGNPNVPGFKDYGGRGIYVCARWLHSFETFLADRGPRPSPRHTIDRIDNNGPYTPENTRWATYSQQAKNRRDNRWHELFGQRMVQADWARKFGISQSSLSRFLSNGRTIDEVATRVGYVPRKAPASMGAAAPLHTRKSS